jgi:hypothetical protein
LGELPFATEYPLTRIRPFAIGSDGSIILGEYEVAVPGKLPDDTSGKDWHSAPAGLFQWSAKKGIQRIEPPGIRLGLASSASADAQVALMSDGQKLYLWSAADGLRLFEPFADWQYVRGSFIALSRDGSSVLGTAPGTPGSGDSKRFFRWRSSGLVWLGSLPDFPYCDARLITPDGSVIVGRCSSVDPTASQGAFHQTFRWTEATGMIAVAPNSELQLDPAQVTPDGNAMLGLPYLGSELVQRLAAWTSTSGMTLVEGKNSNPIWWDFQRSPLDCRDSILSSTGRALQWSAANGLREFEPLAPGETSWLEEQNLDASLFCGTSSLTGNARRAVIWDAHGIRDVAAELEALQVHLEDGLLGSPMGVTSEEDRVITFGNTSQLESRAWIARLPLRH